MHCRPAASLPPLAFASPPPTRPRSAISGWAHGASVRDAVLDECTSHPWSMASKNPRMSMSSTQFTFFVSSRRRGIQRVMLAAPRPKPVREAEEVRLVDGVQHLDGGALNDFVFQRGNTERRSARPPSRCRPDEPARSVRSAFQPFGQVVEVCFQRLAVGRHVSPSTPGAASRFKARYAVRSRSMS